MKSLGGDYALYRKGNVIVISKKDSQLAEFPVESGLTDLLFDSELFAKHNNKIVCEIKNLKSRIYDLEQIKMKTGDLVSFDRRVNFLEELLQSGKNITDHSRLSDMENKIKILIQFKQDLESNTDIDHLERKVKIFEGFEKKCKERFDRIDKNMNVIDMEWHHMRDNLTDKVRSILRSL